MITWRADNPETPPPMMQMRMVSKLAIPSSEDSVWLPSRAACIWGGSRSTDRVRWQAAVGCKAQFDRFWRDHGDAVHPGAP